MATDSNSIIRLPKLNKPADYIQWKRRMYAYIRRDDPTLISLSDKPDGEAATARKIREWEEMSAKAKSNIVLCLGDTVLAKTRKIVDDDSKSAKELWTELHKIHTTSSAQAINNLHNRLNVIKFDDNKTSWDKHVSTFLSIIDELAAFDVELSDQEKTSKLIRSLPKSFEPLAIITTVTSMDFDNMVSAVNAEIERRKSPSMAEATPVADEQPPRAFRSVYRGRGRGRNGFRGRISRGGFRGRARRSYSDDRPSNFVDPSERVCYYCGKPGHYINVCRLKDQHDREGRIQKPHHSNGPRRENEPTYSSRGGYNSRASWGGERNSPPNHHRNNFGARMAYSDPDGFRQHDSRSHLGPYDDREDSEGPSRFGPQARMARLKFRFRTKVARMDTPKTDEAFVDSGATHHFFHSKGDFSFYEQIKPESVEAAFGETNIIGKGTVFIDIAGGFVVEAYHAPAFSSNILASHLLSDSFEVIQSTSIMPFKGCFLFKKGSFSVEDIVWQTRCVDGLYPMQVKDSSNRTPRKALVMNKNNEKSSYRNWHNRMGHISSERYQIISSYRKDVPIFARSITENLECVPCITAKMRKSSTNPALSTRRQVHEEVHYDLSGPVSPSLGGNRYAAHFIEPRTGKSDVFPIRSKSDLPRIIRAYIAQVEARFSEQGYRVRRIRCDNARENITKELTIFLEKSGVTVHHSPSYMPESNGLIERLVQEHWTRARVLLFASDLPQAFWGEALSHSNWLRNRLPSARIDGNVPILLWDPRTIISFSRLHEFGQPGFAFIYRSTSAAGKKLLPRSEYCRFIGVEGDGTLIRVFIVESKLIRIVRNSDFHPKSANILPSISSLLDGLSRQRQMEDAERIEDADTEETMLRCMFSIHVSNPIVLYNKVTTGKSFQGVTDGPALPTSFATACSQPKWAEAIDREYEALVRRKTWEYVRRLPYMSPVPFKWTYRAKQIDEEAENFLFKARCVMRGDLQEPYDDFDPDHLYAPVGTHESFRMLLAFAAQNNLILEGADISNAYLYSKLDKPILMEQPTDSTGKLAAPGCVCLVKMSLYGARQAGHLWGSTLHTDLLSWGFTVSKFDPRLYFLNNGSCFVILLVVVDDMCFASNSTPLLNFVKTKLRSTFDVKLYGPLKSFIRWTVRRTPSGLKVDQRSYALRILQRFGLERCNAVRTPLPTNPDLRATAEEEILLSNFEHNNYRSMIGAILYLAICTRPDLIFSAASLARHMHAPCERHLQMARRLLRYVSGTLDYGLHFILAGSSDVQNFSASADADWGGDLETRRSTTGFVVCVSGTPVFWRSKRQTVISLSSGEAEYIALSSCAKEVSWLRKQWWEVRHHSTWRDVASLWPTTIFVDSTVSCSIATKGQSTARTKHIDIKVHHVRELVNMKVIKLEVVPSKDQVADVLTKPSTAIMLKRFATMANLDGF